MSGRQRIRGRAWRWVAAAHCAHMALGLPMLHLDLYCANATNQWARSSDVVSAHGLDGPTPLQCESALFDEETSCCDTGDVEFVLDHVEHSKQFILRHLADRQAFHAQYKDLALDDHVCGVAVGPLIASRIKRLEFCHVLSEDVIDLMQASARHLLCAACRGTNPAVKLDSAASVLAETEEKLSSEWRRLSRDLASVYGELRRHDVAVESELRAAGRDDCDVVYLGELRSGAVFPVPHAMPLRPWGPAAVPGPARGWGQEHCQIVSGSLGASCTDVAGDLSLPLRVHSFREVWQRWTDSLVQVGTELAALLLVEIEGILLAYYHAENPSSPARALLARPPSPGDQPDQPSPGDIHYVMASAPMLRPAKRVLVIVMPQPSTDRRFDFAADLNEVQLEEHVAALRPFIREADSQLVVFSANPQHCAFLSRAFATSGDRVRIIWRRFALFNADDAVARFIAPRGARHHRSVAVFVLRPGGDGARLAEAAAFLASAEPLPARGWPTPLRAARPSRWPAVMASRARPPALARTVPNLASCPLAVGVLREYLELHHATVMELRSGGTPRVLVYRCSAMGFCGGHGDRLNGALGAFLLAVASRRAFFIDSSRPVPFSLVFGPRRWPGACGAPPGSGGTGGNSEVLLDWRMHGAIAGVGRWANYNDRYTDLIADIPWIVVEEDSPAMVLHSNQRVTMPVLHSAEARTGFTAPVADGLLALPFLHAELLELLLEPTPLLANRHAALRKATLAGHRHLVAVHFRAGDRSPERWSDPPRHSLSELDVFLDCAREAERRLSIPDGDAVWHLAADTLEVASSTRVQQLSASGKLTFLPPDRSDAGVMHIDRSPLALAAMGIVDTWAQWLLVASAHVAILSASGFGVTAAEAGRVPHAFLGAGGSCVEADVAAA